MRCFKFAPVLLAALLAACVQQPVRDASARRAHSAIDYGKYVQGSVPWFHFVSLYSWDSDQPGYVVVWTTPFKAYRLELVGPCLGLQGAMTIGLTSQGGMVSAPQDVVLAGHDRCPIMRIDQLDAKAIRALRSGPKTSSTKGN